MSARRAGRSGRIGAGTVLLILLLLVGAGAFAGVTALEAKRLELEARQAQLAALQQRNRIAPQPAANEVPITINPFLMEESFALAANGLQERIVGLIDEVDGKLISIGVDPQTTGDEEAARRVSVHVAAEMTGKALQKILYDLETQTPLAFVARLNASRRTSRSENDDAAKEEPRLAVSMTVIGYRRKGGPS